MRKSPRGLPEYVGQVIQLVLFDHRLVLKLEHRDPLYGPARLFRRYERAAGGAERGPRYE